MFLRELLVAGRSAATLRSYGMDLLRWWRFLRAVDIGWDRATRVEARDFSCWIQLTVKQRSRVGRSSATSWADDLAGQQNQITGKPALVNGHGPATEWRTRRQCCGVFTTFTGMLAPAPILNPFPLDPSRRSRRAHAHHNPMDRWARERVGRYRPKVPHRAPRAIPDHRFNELFAALGSNRDRAVGRVLDLDRSACVGAAGSAALRRQPGPATDQSGAQENSRGAAGAGVSGRVRLASVVSRGTARPGPPGRTQPVWWTVRRPWRPLNYPAAQWPAAPS